MKRLVIGVLALIGSTGICSTAFGVITGSDHDFSAANWSSGQICLPCHAPHNGTVIADAPLWNHDVSEASYTLYSSATLDADDLSQPAGVSKLCLSCHDGTVAIDAFTGHDGTIFIGTIGTGSGDLGSALNNDHPVSFTYDSALATADGGLWDPSSKSSGITEGGTIDSDMLFAGRMECASCHDVHNKYENTSLLLIDNDGSNLCLTCHNK